MTEKQTESAAQKGVSQADISDPRIGLFDSLITETETLIGYFMDGKDVDTTLTGTERRRLFGAGVRKVVDDVHKGHAAVKETIEAEG